MTEQDPAQGLARSGDPPSGTKDTATYGKTREGGSRQSQPLSPLFEVASTQMSSLRDTASLVLLQLFFEVTAENAETSWFTRWLPQCGHVTALPFSMSEM
jgi:hypothetical protein